MHSSVARGCYLFASPESAGEKMTSQSDIKMIHEPSKYAFMAKWRVATGAEPSCRNVNLTLKVCFSLMFLFIDLLIYWLAFLAVCGGG